MATVLREVFQDEGCGAARARRKRRVMRERRAGVIPPAVP
jgi:hypothetical protein